MTVKVEYLGKEYEVPQVISDQVTLLLVKNQVTKVRSNATPPVSTGPLWKPEVKDEEVSRKEKPAPTLNFSE